MKTFEKIKAYREKADLAIEQLAEESSLPVGLIKLYESGEIHNIPRRDLKAIADALRISGANLLTDRNEPTENGVTKTKNKGTV